MQFTLSDYNQRQDYMDAIDSIQYRAGTTNTAAALSMIRNQGKLPALSTKHRSIFDSIVIRLYYFFLKLHFFLFSPQVLEDRATDHT